MLEIAQQTETQGTRGVDPEKKERLSSIVKGHRLLETLELKFKEIKPTPTETDAEGRVTKSTYSTEQLLEKNVLADKIVRVHRAILRALDDSPDYTDLNEVLRTML